MPPKNIAIDGSAVSYIGQQYKATDQQFPASNRLKRQKQTPASESERLF